MLGLCGVLLFDINSYCGYIQYMKTVGIRNLKNSLSQYIDLVKAGEKVLITEHDRVVAAIVPSAGHQASSDLLEEYLSEQEKTGSLIRARKKVMVKKSKTRNKIDEDRLREICNATRAERI